MFANAEFFERPRPSPLYRQFFTADEIRDLDATPLDSAVSEIAILRVLITRVLASIAKSGERASSEPRRSSRHEARGKRKPALESRLGILIAFCQAASTIASLARLELKRRDLSLSELAPFGALDESEL